MLTLIDGQPAYTPSAWTTPLPSEPHGVIGHPRDEAYDPDVQQRVWDVSVAVAAAGKAGEAGSASGRRTGSTCGIGIRMYLKVKQSRDSIA